MFLIFGDAAQSIFSRIHGYTVTGTEETGLHFYNVIQTIREAGKIPFQTLANRIAGSEINLLIAAVGYLFLIVRHRLFLLTIPLIGIGLFAYWGGLRFTVYAVPVAALGATYLFVVLGEQIRSQIGRYGLLAVATLAMLYPNIRHIIDYRVPTVFNHNEVADLTKLNTVATGKDYTLAWWDYAYPIVFYSDTQTLIDGGKHQHDNFIISTILQTDSSALAARLARLSVETYAQSMKSYQHYTESGRNPDKIPPQFRMTNKKGEMYHSGKGPVSNVLFRDNQADQKDPNLFLDKIKSGLIKMPEKTRDIFLYMPYRMMNIFPTVMVFGNIDLTTGNPLRKAIFAPSGIATLQQEVARLRNGMILDLKRGIARIGTQNIPLQTLVISELSSSGAIRVQRQAYHLDGRLIAVYLKSYGQMVVMDPQTFRSMYVQMFMLGHYDPHYFEPVVTSPYTRIYRLKI